jgi:hypothetical protein
MQTGQLRKFISPPSGQGDQVCLLNTPFHFVLRNNITVKPFVFRYNIQFARPPVWVDDTVWLYLTLTIGENN